MTPFELTRDRDGSERILSTQALGAYDRTVCDALARRATRTPAAVFVAERDAHDGWRELTYGEAHARVRTIGGGLLAAGASAERPVAIVAENGIDHALCTLAALYVGIPVSPISVGYASASAAPERLADLARKLTPAFVFANDPAVAERAARVARVVTDLRELAGDAARADAAARDVDPDAVAKIMFTSGSTGTPKGVVTTQRMLCANQAMLSAVWPELALEPPLAVDWLPWSHCFGGSHNFGLILHNGGAIYVDGGRPVPGLFAPTLRNLADRPPTMFFSVPRGFALLVEHALAHPDFAARLFARLRVCVSGGASLPDSLRLAVFDLAKRYAPHAVRITSSWGATETAPFSTTSWGEPEPDRDTIGVPAPGVEIKLAPTADTREIRVRGVNVTPGYWRDPEATRAAFDDDGFYRTGDAGTLKDPNDPSRGILFAGRVVENFKLTSGTWVNVGALRLALLERGASAIADVVVCGHDRDEIGVLVFAQPTADRTSLAAFVATVLAAHNVAAPGGSTRVARALVLDDPPSLADGEITDKGSINQRRALARRAASVTDLYADPPHAATIFPRAAVTA